MGSHEGRMKAQGLILWLVETREDGAVLRRPVIVTGEVSFGACLDPLPPELLARCVPLDADDGEKGGA